VVESVGSEYQGRVTVVAVDAAVDPESARELGGFAVPLLVAIGLATGLRWPLVGLGGALLALAFLDLARRPR
jgi:hypothetical protein